MYSYFHYVHNVTCGSNFDRLRAEDQAAIISQYICDLRDLNTLEQALEKETDSDVLRFITEYLDLKEYCRNIVLTTNTTSYVDDSGINNIRAIINLRQINSIQYPHKLLLAVNTLLPISGLYVGRLETYADQKNKIYSQAGRHLGVFHAMSQAEALGRLVYCGFEIVALKQINRRLYFVAKKMYEPFESEYPSYYPIIKLRRVGKNGKMFGVYRLRTMHPYSEYLQDRVVKLKGYNDQGKPEQDFRLTRWGKFFSKFWIDEFPQIVNVLKGEMKLVGLRPLSQVKFNAIPEDLQAERMKYKPGYIPPYVSLNMPDDKIKAEQIYISELKKHPYITDIRYFFRAVFNIITNKIRGA